MEGISINEPYEKRSEEVTSDRWEVLNGRVTESSQQIGILRKTIQELIRSMDAERNLTATVQHAVRELDGRLASETKTRSDDVRGLRDALRAETAARLELTAIEEGFWSTAQDRSTRLEDRAAKMEDLLRDSLERCSVELNREKEAREQLATELHESLGRTLALSGQLYDLRTAHEGRLDVKCESLDVLQERLLVMDTNHKQDMASLKADLELRKAKWAEELEELRMKFSEDRVPDERIEKIERTETTDRTTGDATTREAVSIIPPTRVASAGKRGSSSRATSAEVLPREVPSFQQELRTGVTSSRVSSCSVLSPPAPGPISVSPSAWFIKPCSWSRATSPSPMVATVPRPLRSRRFTCAGSPQQQCVGSPTSTIRTELSRNHSRGTLEPQNLQQHWQQRQPQQQQQQQQQQQPTLLHQQSQPQLPVPSRAMEVADGEKPVTDGMTAPPRASSTPWHGTRRRSVGCSASPAALVSG